MKAKNKMDECGFVIKEDQNLDQRKASAKMTCSDKGECSVCKYCRIHCLEHLMLRPHIKFVEKRHAHR